MTEAILVATCSKCGEVSELPIKKLFFLADEEGYNPHAYLESETFTDTGWRYEEIHKGVFMRTQHLTLFCPKCTGEF